MILILIIIYIIIKEFNDSKKIIIPQENQSIKISKKIKEPKILDTRSERKAEKLNKVNELFNERLEENINVNQVDHFSEPEIKEFSRPNPWTKLVTHNSDFPYHFYLKVKIPSLNDFETWKQIVPNLEFSPRSGELIIPSKDEASALALANLIVINFSGQMSLKEILEKNLIQISVSKAQSHELVQIKLREQIMENLFGKNVTNIQSNYEQDLAKNNKPNFQGENFTDTFQHFHSQTNTFNDIEAYEGNDYTYL